MLKGYAVTVLGNVMRDPLLCAEDIFYAIEKLRERRVAQRSGAKGEEGVNRSTKQESKAMFDKVMNVTRVEKSWDGKHYAVSAQLGNKHVTISGLTEEEVRSVDITKLLHVTAYEAKVVDTATVAGR